MGINKILTVVGARPQFVKLAPFSFEARKFFKEVIVHTGQHYDHSMSDSFFNELTIPKPDYNLSIGSGSHGTQTGEMLIKIEKVLESEKPDCVIVFGDTNTTLAAALCAVKKHIPLIHVEAGLRSFNMSMPEEVNRIVADHVSTLLFAPTNIAMQNLHTENLGPKAVLTGDIMVDALLKAAKLSSSQSRILAKLGLETASYSLMTLHRPYNVDDSMIMNNIFKNLSEFGQRIIFPVHPRTKKMLESAAVNVPVNIITTDPLGYLDFVQLEQNASRIITDSGGIQKEAFILRKPCITLRTESEWIETIQAGANLLIDPKLPNFYIDINEFRPSGFEQNIFGQNVAAKMIHEIVKIIH